jgi:hypothetical protein
MDDEKPVVEQLTDTIGGAVDATKQAAKTVVKKVKKAAKSREEGSAEEEREGGEESQEGQEVEALTPAPQFRQSLRVTARRLLVSA